MAVARQGYIMIRVNTYRRTDEVEEVEERDAGAVDGEHHRKARKEGAEERKRRAPFALLEERSTCWGGLLDIDAHAGPSRG